MQATIDQFREKIREFETQTKRMLPEFDTKKNAFTFSGNTAPLRQWDADLKKWDDQPLEGPSITEVVEERLGVTLCETVGAARAAVAKLVGATNALGIKNEAVLVQEWLRKRPVRKENTSRRLRARHV